VELTRTFAPEVYAQALESWRWIGLDGTAPVAATAFGDVILQRGEAFLFLDTIEGDLLQAWPSREALEQSLATEEGQDRYLLAGLAQSAEHEGLVCGPGQVYGFRHPPVLGGPIELDNVEVVDFVVAVDVAGQVHEQVRDLPPGTPISGVTLDGQPT